MPLLGRLLQTVLGSSSLLLFAAPAYADPCGPADLDGDGFVDFTDYLEFLNLFDAQDPRVDFTGDGLIDFADYLEFLNLYEAGCLPDCDPAAALAAAALPAFPYANFVDAYLNTSTVSIAADPARYPDLTGRATRIYITTNQSWTPGMPLTDVRGAFQTFTWPGGPLTANIITLNGSDSLPFDAGEEIGIGYDLVIDADANGVFDACDLVDGPGPEAGFYKFRDLTTDNAGTPVTQVNTVSIPVGRTYAGYEDQRWYYPSNIASRGRLPLVIISHGNGHQYTWYDFLGRHLASYGMIVIAHENNTPQSIPPVSISTLDHTNTVLALQATLGGGVLNGHINQNEIYWIGHSRGGEGVAYAWPRLNQGQYTPTGGFPLVFSAADVKYVQSIAPVNEQGMGPIISGAITADFMSLYGAADGDVCGCPGFEVAWSFGVYERALQRRNSVYIHGVGHNEFNCCGFADAQGPGLIGRPAAQAIQKAYTLASIKYYRTGNVPSGEAMWRQYETFKPGDTLAAAVVDHEFKDAGPGRKFIIDDFQAQPAAGTSSSGGPVTFTVTNLVENLMQDVDGTFAWVASDPFNGMTRRPGSNRAVVFDYSPAAPSSAYALDIVSAGQDASAYGYLSFRAGQITQHPFTTATLADQDFDVELEDLAGQTSRIRISTYGGGIEEVYQRSGGWQNELETVRIRLTDFTADGRSLDLTRIAKLRFLFGSGHGTPQGRLAFDDIEWVK